MEDIPKAGEYYRHFKDRYYQIVTMAIHSETEEWMVVYQALYGERNSYVRPLEMFMSDVDRVKYPDVQQQKRFTKVASVPAQAGNLHPQLLELLEEPDWDKKLIIFRQMGNALSHSDYQMLGTAWDLGDLNGTLEQQFELVEGQLLLRRKYAGQRLR